jgi:hypothetical protein
MVGADKQIDKIDVNGDSRVSWKSAVINGRTYGTVALICAYALNFRNV